MDADLWQTVRAGKAWLDSNNGTGEHEVTLRILKLVEEAGEAAAARIGMLGTNPRKNVTHTAEEVAAELADVAITALVAIESLGFDAAETMKACAAKVSGRIAG